MKLFTANQIKEADNYTIKHEPILSIDLMERAATAFYQSIAFDGCEHIILCGLSNNGADGLAVARILNDDNNNMKRNVHVVIINYSDKRSDNFKINLERLKSYKKTNIRITEINKIEDLIAFSYSENTSTIFIDALLGIGTNRAAKGLLADVIDYINSLNKYVISIDIPSGLFADGGNSKGDSIIRATETFTFQFSKLAFLFSENAEYVGVYKIIDIGLSEEYISQTDSQYYYTSNEDVKPILKTRFKYSHKGNFGHALIIAGSYGKIGAAVLSTKACLNGGAGLVTAHIPKCGYDVIQMSIPEAMISADLENYYISDNINLEKYNAIGVGPGMGMEKQTQNTLKLIIQNSSVPIVFDADAINILSENKTWLSFLPAKSILTPHIKEFERLVGKVSNTPERLKQQLDFSLKYNVYVILKGAHTSISTPNGKIHFNSSGNPGMATGGSGDVLTGILTSLLAQGYSSIEACVLGVYLHGLAGDFAADSKTQESMIASDIIYHLPDAYKFLRM